ncbi:perforin-1-like [Sinocyclocheilus rhinocerous]|uniref:Perforin-1-like n=1 Tax=Sinocyclocheilus rhinocerous TaxID=307959 RepID=A0A673JWG4_9TELE|nr:PREDICTED: perforin-1-like [Sinocyclocheilus rhinocerous]XP_016422644.1 PREDICTED: perforin-1-like [Sinocyclocheilus rhinocerous]XP_016422645.1 PREDICTED: perforin-1-like [Sinocyclocheilus rhinocerous]
MKTNQCVFPMFLCISLILTHWDTSSACHIGSHDECEQAPFVPGYNLAGEGFDVVRMRRKGAFLINVKSHMDNGTCTVCKNRFQGGQMQKLPSVVRDWRSFSRCSNQLSSALHHSVNSLMKSSTSFINKWEIDLSLDDIGRVILGGSHSDIAQFAQYQNAMDKATFALHEHSCTYYSYRVTDHPELSTEFSKHLQRLPTQYDVKTKPLYRRTIDTYGTHYIRQVHLGGRVRRVTAFRTCLATLKGFSETDIENCLNIELKITLGFLPANAMLSNKCSQILKDNIGMGFYQGFMTHKIEVLGGEKYFPDLVLNQSPAEAYSNWVKSLHDNPEVISYAIFPLYHLVADPEVSANLKSAITEYIEENMFSVDQKENQECSQTANLDHNCCPMLAGHGKLVVFVLGATGMNEDYFSATDGFVKIWYNGIYRETEVVMNDNDPEWYTLFNFGSIEFGHELIFEVWDSDVKFDDFVGRCVVRPEHGSHLRSCSLQRGIFYFAYHASCDAHLTGPRCSRYSPQT